MKKGTKFWLIMSTLLGITYIVRPNWWPIIPLAVITLVGSIYFDWIKHE